MKRPTLGDQELALLRYVAANAPVTVGETATGYGEDNGLARNTVETMMERLRKKSFLTRSRDGGVFRYSPAVDPQELSASLVGRFVEQTLSGSLLPFVTYFSQQNRLSASELAELERLVSKLQNTGKEADHDSGSVESRGE